MKIGDTVMIKMGLVPDEIYGKEVFIEEMRPYVGKQATIASRQDTGWLLTVDDKEWTWSDEMLCLIEESQEDRSVTLLRACRDLLAKQANSGYTLDLLSQTVFYDEVNCDGYCLLTDIASYLEYGQ